MQHRGGVCVGGVGGCVTDAARAPSIIGGSPRRISTHLRIATMGLICSCESESPTERKRVIKGRAALTSRQCRSVGAASEPRLTPERPSDRASDQIPVRSDSGGVFWAHRLYSSSSPRDRSNCPPPLAFPFIAAAERLRSRR